MKKNEIHPPVLPRQTHLQVLSSHPCAAGGGVWPFCTPHSFEVISPEEEGRGEVWIIVNQNFNIGTTLMV
jgi:hypothetical protein